MDLNSEIKTEIKTEIKEDAYFEQIIHNIKRRAYRIIGMGSGRVVFDLADGYVAKVAKNSRGRAQNEVEYKIAVSDDSNLFAKILCASEQFDLILMQKASRLRSISFVWDYFKVRRNSQLFRLDMLQDISNKYDLVLADLGRASNWGKIDGRPVIVDYGFNRRVQRKYYMRPFRLF